MEAFVDQVPGKLAESKFMSKGAVRLNPRPDGSYLAMIVNTPLLDDHGLMVVYSKDDITKWGLDKYAADSLQRREGAEYDTYNKRVKTELEKLQKKDPYVLERFDPYAGSPVFNQQVLSKEGYGKLKAEGLDKKPLQEILKTLKEQRK